MPVLLPWRFSVFGETFKEEQLTIDQFIALEDEFGVTWRLINPINSAKQARHIAAVMYAERHGCTLDDAKVKIGQVSAAEFVESIDVPEEDEVDPPGAVDLTKT